MGFSVARGVTQGGSPFLFVYLNKGYYICISVTICVPFSKETRDGY